jgi:hypothetical protein
VRIFLIIPVGALLEPLFGQSQKGCSQKLGQREKGRAIAEKICSIEDVHCSLEA